MPDPTSAYITSAGKYLPGRRSKMTKWRITWAQLMANYLACESVF